MRDGFFTRILSLLVLVGLALAPLGMGSPAMAAGGNVMAGMSHEAAPAAGHPCAGKQKPAGKQMPDNCCALACSFIPAAAAALAAHSAPPSLVLPDALVRSPGGLEPEAEPPPPRSA